MRVIHHPGRPGTPGTPDQLIETDLVGWSSGAVSIATISGDGGYAFKVPANVVGVVCGLAGDFVGVGYRTIAHALYFTRGRVVLMEHGEQVEDLGGYLTGDTFVLWRAAGKVAVYRNGLLETVRPQLIRSTFRLASSLYLNGDTVVDAKLASAPAATGDIDAAIGPLSSFLLEGAGGFMVANLGPLSAESRADNHATMAGSMGPLASRMSKGVRGDLVQTISPLTAYAEGGLMAPAWASSEATMRALTASCRGFTGEVGHMEGGFGGIDALASDRPYCEMKAKIGGGFFAFIGEFLDLNVLVANLPGGYKLNASASPVDVTGVDAELPALTLEAVCGAQLDARLPMLTLDAEASITQIAILDADLPALTLDAEARVGGVAVVDAALPVITLDAVCGAEAIITLPGGYVLVAEAIVGGTASLDGRLPTMVLEAFASPINFAVCDVLLPAVVSVQGASLDVRLPMLRLYAVASDSAPATHESYAINLTTGAVTRYTDYPFDNVLRLGGRFFGIKADGVFELAGETDDGAPIHATVKTFCTDFGSANLKKIPWVYLVGRLDDSLSVTVEPAGGTPYSYPTVGAYAGARLTHRVKVGGGMRGTRYSISIQNPGGSDFELDRVEAVVNVLTRAM